MYRLFTLVVALLFMLTASAQSVELNDNVKALRTELNSMKTMVQHLEEYCQTLSDSITVLRSVLRQLSADVDSVNRRQFSLGEESKQKFSKVDTDIATTNNSLNQTSEKTSQSLRKHLVYGVGAFLLTLLIAFGSYFLLRRRMNHGSATIDSIRAAQEHLQEESVRLDERLLQLLEHQQQMASLSGVGTDNHSLALKVADEVVRIEMNLVRMDRGVKGYKQLSKAVERIKDNFQAQGYELVELLGKEYNDGMRLNADFVIDEELPEGTRIITSIIKPQVNYQGKMIQKATVTVSQNL